MFVAPARRPKGSRFRALTLVLAVVCVAGAKAYDRTVASREALYHRTPSARPRELTDVDGTLFFVADDGLHGRELWRSDGTAAGTVLVRDIHPGLRSSDPFCLTHVDGILFFLVDEARGPCLWKSDGTADGTVKVGALPACKDPLKRRFGMVAVDGRLFFPARDFAHGTELWTSDGTPEGTHMIKDIRSGSDSSLNPNLLANSVELNGALLFVADDGRHGPEVWSSDGTASGTVLLRDSITGPDVFVPHLLGVLDGAALFAVKETGSAPELWRTDGTTEGTERLVSIGTPASSAPKAAIMDQGALVFPFDDGAHGTEPWRSDGTRDGTHLVEDTIPGTEGLAVEGLTCLSGRAYFLVWGYEGFYMLRIAPRARRTSDGAAPGGERVSRPNIGGLYVSPLVAAGGNVVFGTRHPEGEGLLWQGDLAGREVVPITTGFVTGVTGSGGQIFFARFLGSVGEELWRTDGTRERTVLVKDVHGGLPVGVNDADRDGVIDQLEGALGTDPEDPHSVPGGFNPCRLVRPLRVSRARIRLRFDGGGTDTVLLTGVMSEYQRSQKRTSSITVYVGGFVLKFDGFRNGLYRSMQGRMRVWRSRGMKKVLGETVAGFSLRIRARSLAAHLGDEGLINADLPRPGVPRSVLVMLMLDNGIHVAEVDLLYRAKRGRGGSGSMTRPAGSAMGRF